MQQIKPFQEKAFALSTSYDSEFSGLPVRTIGLRLTCSITGAPVTVRTDGAHRMLGTPEINQAENPLIRMGGAAWRLLSAITRGSFDNYNAPTTATYFEANAVLDLQKILPTAMINAADKKIFLRGQFGALTDLAASGNTAHAGALRAWTESSDLDPTKGFLRPKISETSFPLNDATDNPQVFKFEQDTVIPFLMIQAWDNSALDRVDGLIRNIRVDRVGANGVTELARGRWGHFRSYLGTKANFTAADYAISAGCVIVPLINRRNPQYNYAEVLKAGDSLTVNYDTLSTGTIEESYTAVTAAANDAAKTTIVGFTAVEGTGDVQTQLRTIGGAGPSGGGIVQAVARNAKERRALARAQRFGAQ